MYGHLTWPGENPRYHARKPPAQWRSRAGPGADPPTTVTKEQVRVKRIDPQPQQPTPPQPEPLRAPLPPQAQTALTRLDKALHPQAAQ